MNLQCIEPAALPASDCLIDSLEFVTLQKNLLFHLKVHPQLQHDCFLSKDLCSISVGTLSNLRRGAWSKPSAQLKQWLLKTVLDTRANLVRHLVYQSAARKLWRHWMYAWRRILLRKHSPDDNQRICFCGSRPVQSHISAPAEHKEYIDLHQAASYKVLQRFPRIAIAIDYLWPTVL